MESQGDVAALVVFLRAPVERVADRPPAARQTVRVPDVMDQRIGSGRDKTTTSSTPFNGRCRLRTVRGSSVPARSLGTLNLHLARGFSEQSIRPGAVANVSAGSPGGS